MTTIVWDGHTLAVDSQMTNGNSKSIVEKLFKLEGHGAVAGTGRIADLLAFRDWVLRCMPQEARPVLLEKDVFIGFHAHLENGLPVCDRYWGNFASDRLLGPTAEGSGRDFALAAMRMKADSYGAVYVACQYDIYTCPPIRFYSPLLEIGGKQLYP